MRTTLDLDDDIVEIARQLARQRSSTIGKMVSDLARLGLEPKASSRTRNGVPLFTPKAGARTPSLPLVNRLRDES